VVRFQISQIGSDVKAQKFLAGLDSDPALQDALYCTAGKYIHFAKGMYWLQCFNEEDGLVMKDIDLVPCR